MICPHCGKETSDGSTQCDHCGGVLHTGVNWGVRHSSNTYRPQYSSDTEKLTNYVAATPALHKAKPQGLKVALGAAAVALVAAVGLGGFMLATSQNAQEAERAQASAEQEEGRWHDVTVSVEAPGLADGGTSIPVQITGADAGGNAYDAVAYVNAEGKGLRLQPGKYGIHVAASPITSEGGLFLYNTNNKWFSVSTELEPGEPVDVSDEIELVLEPADPSDITRDALEASRHYALEGGADEKVINQMLSPFLASVEEASVGAPFNGVQTYRNVTFVGDVRTNTGFVPASGIPDVRQIITRTSLFLFTGNTLYYADNSNTDYNNSIALHSRNMSTGQESILATDLSSQSRPCYANGNIIYTSTEWGSSVRRIELSSGETFPVSDELSWEFSKLAGVHENSVVVSTSDNELPQIAVVPLDEGETTYATLGETYGTVVGVYGDTVLVAMPEWDVSRIAGYELDGTLKWESEIPDATALGKRIIYQDGSIYATSSGGTQLVWVNMETGDARVYNADVPYLFGPMAAQDGSLYFAGSDSYASYDSNGTANATYTTYKLDLDSGDIENLGAYEAPSDEELAAQQEEQYWDNTWSYGYTWGDGTGTYNWDTTGTGTGTWDATGTNTWGNTGVDTTGNDPNVGNWDANGAWVGNNAGGYDANGNLVGTGTGTWDTTGTGTWDTTGTGTGTWDATGTGTGTWDATGTYGDATWQ